MLRMAHNYKIVVEKVNAEMSPFGFEVHPFKIGWYNDNVMENFKFNYSYDTLALLIISTPELFDKGLVPFFLREECPGTGDLLDNCIKEHFNNIKKEFPDFDIEAIHDFELLPSRRPKVLVQTAGHVSGAAYYYRRTDVQPDPWDEKVNIFGVSIHPKYGGWFALRGVLIFKNLDCPDLVQKAPLDVVSTTDQRKELLERFNFRWKDWTFRDIIPVETKYSEHQKLYFATPPKERHKLMDQIKDELKQKDSELNG